MKKLIKFALVVVLMCSAFQGQSQWIQSLTILPANPTSTDTITILAECSFPSGGCSEHVQNFSILGNDIFAEALHCLGPLAFICDYTDTFKINPLPIGNYNFHFQLDIGSGPVPCTPGIVSGPSDSVVIMVSPTVGVNEFISQDEVQVIPNPFTDHFYLSGIPNEAYPVTLEIFSPSGKIVRKIIVTSASQSVPANRLSSEYFNIRITTSAGKQFMVSVVKQ